MQIARVGLGKSDVGRERANNEDSIFISNEKIGNLPNLYIVADGMGGHNAGEVASSKSIDFFKEYINKLNKNWPIEKIMLEGTGYANKKVYELSLNDESQVGMGTTFTACVLDDGKLHFAHVGDSRLYLIFEDEIVQVTQDHTFVNEMYMSGQLTKEQVQNHPQKNMLTRALGTENKTQIDIGFSVLEPEGTILICSDGLTNMISEEEILTIMNLQSDNNEKIDKLIDAANKKGGYDNISVIII